MQSYGFIVLSAAVFQNWGAEGDGYQSRSSPHTSYETFLGLSVKLAAKVSQPL